MVPISIILAVIKCDCKHFEAASKRTVVELYALTKRQFFLIWPSGARRGLMSPILTIDLANAAKKASWLLANTLTNRMVATSGIDSNTWSDLLVSFADMVAFTLNVVSFADMVAFSFNLILEPRMLAAPGVDSNTRSDDVLLSEPFVLLEAWMVTARGFDSNTRWDVKLSHELAGVPGVDSNTWSDVRNPLEALRFW